MNNTIKNVVKITALCIGLYLLYKAIQMISWSELVEIAKQGRYSFQRLHISPALAGWLYQVGDHPLAWSFWLKLGVRFGGQSRLLK